MHSTSVQVWNVKKKFTKEVFQNVDLKRRRDKYNKLSII